MCCRLVHGWQFGYQVSCYVNALRTPTCQSPMEKTRAFGVPGLFHVLARRRFPPFPGSCGRRRYGLGRELCRALGIAAGCVGLDRGFALPERCRRALSAGVRGANSVRGSGAFSVASGGPAAVMATRLDGETFRPLTIKPAGRNRWGSFKCRKIKRIERAGKGRGTASAAWSGRVSGRRPARGGRSFWARPACARRAVSIAARGSGEGRVRAGLAWGGAPDGRAGCGSVMVPVVWPGARTRGHISPVAHERFLLDGFRGAA